MQNPTPTRLEALLEQREFVLALARRLSRDEDTAQEIAQDTWVAATTRGASIRSMRGWLSRVIVNFARQSARGQERRERRERAVARPEHLPSTDEIAERLEVERRVVAAVASLPERYRTVIFHRYFEGATVSEVARRLDLPEPTVRTQLRRAIERLRITLDDAYAGDRDAWLVPLAVAGTGASFVPAGAAGVSEAAAHGGTANAASTTSHAGGIGAASKASAILPWIATAAVVTLVILGATRFVADPSPDLARAAALADGESSTSPDTDGNATEARDADGSANHVDETRTTTGPTPSPPASSAASATVHGSVVDGLRRPVAGAVIDAWTEYADFRDGMPPLASSTTDTDGSYTIVIDTFGVTYLAARAAGMVTRTETILTRESRRETTLGRFVLPEAHTATGIVRSADGYPIAGALVLATNENRMTETVGHCATTDADGRFALDGLPLAETYLNVFAPGHVTRQVGPASPDRGTWTIELQPGDPGTLTGVVRETDGSTLVADARIHVTLHGDSRYPTNYYRLPYALSLTQTDAAGRWSLPMLPPGRYDVSAYRDGLTIPQRRDVIVRAGETTSLDFTATFDTASSTIMTGSATTTEGHPLSGETLRVARRSSHLGTLVEVSEQGTFELEAPVAEGEVFYVWIEPRSGGHALVGENVRAGFRQVVATTGSAIEIVASPAARLAGYVRTHDGQPIVGAHVEIVGESWLEHQSTSASTTTAGDGSFTFEALAPQSRPVAIRVEPASHYFGPSAFYIHPDRYELTSGADIDDVEVRVSPRASLSGRVVDDAGTPVAGAFLDARTSGSTPWHDATFTSRDGTFTMDRLPANTEIVLHVSYTHGDRRTIHRKYPLTLAAGEHPDDVALELPVVDVPADAIRGTIRFEDGSVPGSVSIVRSYGSGFGSHRCRGNFLLENLPSEPVHVRAVATPDLHIEDPPYGFLLSDPQTVDPGTAVELVIDRTRAGTASGRFAPESPRPDRVIAQIQVSGERWNRGCPVRIDDDGTFRLPPITPGTYDLELRGDGIQPKSLVSIEIVEAVDLDLGEVAFESALPFRGTVTDPNGVPIDGALVKVGVASYGPVLDEKPIPREPYTRTDTSGYFELAPRLGYDFGVWKEGYTQATFTRPDPSGEPEAVVLFPAGDLSITNLPPEVSEETGSSLCFWSFTIESHDPAKGRLVTRRQSHYGKRLDLYAIEAGDYTLHFWKADENSQTDPPPTPEPRAYLRFEFTIVAGQTTTIDFGAAW